MADRAVDKHQILSVKVYRGVFDSPLPVGRLVIMQQLLNLETVEQLAVKIDSLPGVALKHDKGCNLTHRIPLSHAIVYGLMIADE
ncbi:hypothetical protein D3C80_1925740 [compost metagenome]